MYLDYIIIQAGGKGTRMRQLTANKPKALVSIDNLPMIFHLFRKYPTKKFIVIGDYKFDVLKKYLAAFGDMYDISLVCAAGKNGTCAGISEALTYIPENESFMLIWCDLVLPDDYEVPDTSDNIIGISKDFPCRWKYEDGAFAEERSTDHGVAGHFIFKDKSCLSDIPAEGEFVRWLQTKGMKFTEQPLYKTHEYGLYSEWERLPKMRCRPFNSLRIEGDRIYKTAIDEQGRKLAVREIAWYKKLQSQHFKNIPTIYNYDPLCMELIDGKNIYEYTYISEDEKKNILAQIIDCLKQVHGLEEIPVDQDSYYEAYLGKTYERLKKVRDLVPFANDPTVTVNGRVCRNIFYHQKEVEDLVMQYMPRTFKLIHGDSTFSNSMLRSDNTPVLFDPRGYFGTTEFFGDAAYDWVKLYYSLFSNYDQFNLKRFNLTINERDVKLEIASNNWECMEDEFFRLLDGEVSARQMKILLAIVWLSLTTYSWDDYDSICGAFYNGLYYLEEALSMESAYSYFSNTILQLEDAAKKISMNEFEKLLNDCKRTLNSNHKIIASGLGKNVPICEKFEGTMVSLGLDAQFLHTNSAVHGDMGMVKPGDLVIILSKSGSTSESVYLAEQLEKRKGVKIWLLSCQEHSVLADMLENKLIIPLDHEGDPWNIVPNNSTTLFLIVLQTIAMQMIKKMDIKLEDFKPNHPGGAIGVKLLHE